MFCYLFENNLFSFRRREGKITAINPNTPRVRLFVTIISTEIWGYIVSFFSISTRELGV